MPESLSACIYGWPVLRLGVAAFLKIAGGVEGVILFAHLREGFGLTMSEAMWKGRAVIGGDVGGILYQIITAGHRRR